METMKKKKLDRRVFKKEGEELQNYLNFRKRGSKVESKKILVIGRYGNKRCQLTEILH